ncbi:Oxidoreductase probably involved in sulfite reduction [hydrothermal vent metagenome]|uniref:Oxidoreductase probably involved in sulfite reduction n=1 Tax=hydrothermal vent metagenome TaxID=652676 RepID=A0A3B0SWS2_9ZZZZ
MKIIKDKAIVTDSWTHYPGEGDLPAGDVIVPLGVWQEADLSGHNVGLLLEPGDDMSNIRDDLDFFDLIAINFPTFMDGRGYSMAKILRDRYGYTKEIRAVGDVMRDQLFYMQRCGFTSYEIKSGKDINDALKGLEDFSVTYQTSSDEPLPLYRRH